MILVLILPPQAGILSNTASINSGAADTNATNNSHTVTNTVLNDLSVTKTLSTTGLLGQNSLYTYTLASSMVMGDAGGTITLTDTFPTGANIVSAPTGGGWTCDNQSGFPLVGPRTITCTRATATAAVKLKFALV